jgi:hypothetical protein
MRRRERNITQRRLYNQPAALSRLRRTALTLVWALAVGGPASASFAATADGTFEISVPKLAAPPSMRGTIDDSWSQAAHLSFNDDFTYLRAGDPTSVYVAQDANALDVAFVAVQKQRITANQETNGSGVMSDDAVGIVLWPQGTQGFQYQFVSNARGARDQTSSENSAYSPHWTAVAKRSDHSYVVTMRIPLDIIRTGRSTSWKAQFFRMVVATNSMEVWAHYPGQRNAIDPAYGGTLDGMAAAGVASLRPKPRLGVYGLGELTTKAFGGNTSRLGADLAVPVTATSSLLGTFHPDYSNLEIDQQTIAPTAYARHYAEVRPFFTQATSNFIYVFSCTNCPQTLYTQAIPTFSDGYAYEGAQGPFTFGFYDAAGRGRSDSGETLNYQMATQKDLYGISIQRLAVDTPQVHDDTTEQSSGYLNQRTHLFVYFNSATDRGTNVTTPGLGDYFEYGGGYASQLTTAGFTLQKIGEQFNPVDGYVAQTNIAGYSLFCKHTFNFAPADMLRDVSTNEFYGRFHDNPETRRRRTVRPACSSICAIFCRCSCTPTRTASRLPTTATFCRTTATASSWGTKPPRPRRRR